LSQQQCQRFLVFITAFSFFVLCSCSRDDGFTQAIEKAQQSAVTQVNPTGAGLPYFAPHTLTPTWDKAAEHVKVPSLKLRDQSDSVRDQSMFQGKLTFVAFFFATCTGYCPALIERLKEVEAALNTVPNMQYVVLSVDPERDTPDKLKAYAKLRKLDTRRWALMTGDRQVIYSLAKDTFVSEAFKRASGKSFVHSEHFYLIDSTGSLRAVLNGTRLDVADKAKKTVEELLAGESAIESKHASWPD
jgi:protein SCO1/2